MASYKHDYMYAGKWFTYDDGSPIGKSYDMSTPKYQCIHCGRTLPWEPERYAAYPYGEHSDQIECPKGIRKIRWWARLIMTVDMRYPPTKKERRIQKALGTLP